MQVSQAAYRMEFMLQRNSGIGLISLLFQTPMPDGAVWQDPINVHHSAQV